MSHLFIHLKTFFHYKEPFAQWKAYMDVKGSLWTINANTCIFFVKESVRCERTALIPVIVFSPFYPVLTKAKAQQTHSVLQSAHPS